jgi:YYY domain-containing protein
MTVTTPDTNSSPQPANRRADTLLAILFIAAVLFAVYFRFVGLNWDENQHLHPDERFLTMVETGIAPVKSLAEFFDSAKSSLNPINRGYGFFVYGTLPIFLVRYVGEALKQTGYDQITLIGRQLSALADLGALLFLFVMARRLYGDRVAVLSALLSAAAVLPIQQAHFFTVDTFANFFVVAAFYFIMRAASEGGWLDFAASGLAVGMAVACKANVWPSAGFVALAAVMYWSQDARTRSQPGRTILKLALAGLVAALAFRVFQPYAFTGPHIWNISIESHWRANMNQVQGLVNGDQDYPPGHQWTDRAPIIFPWTNMVVWGMGLPLGLVAWIGWAWIAIEILRRKQWRTHLLPWLWATAFFVYQGTQWVKSMRYILPVYPFFILFAAYWLSNFKLQLGNFKVGRKTASVLTAIAVIGTLAWAWGFTQIYRRPVSRITASRWIYENVPTAATLRYSAGSDERVLQLGLPNSVTYATDQPVTIPFRVPVTATVKSIIMNYLADPNFDPQPETFRVVVADDPFGNTAIAQAELTANFAQGGNARGNSYTFDFLPAVLNPGRDYFFISAVVAGGPVVANTSTIGNEHWDDGLPLRLDGKDGFSIYKGIEIQNYAEDEPSKLPLMISWLTQADYLVLSSNRLYGSIPRLPLRYPMTSEYYRALFDGRLGFEKVAEFSSYVNVGPLWFPDQESTEALGMPNPFDQLPGRINIPLPPAEEAFSVYDHPRVVIFRKTQDFSPEKATQVLGKFDLSQAVRLWPKQATAAPAALMLDQDVWQEQQASSTWSEIYNRDSLLNRFPVLAIAAVWLLIALMGTLAWPVIAFAWPALPDRGWGVTGPLGLLIVAYLAWLAASLRVLTFARGTLIAATLILAVVGALLAWRRRSDLAHFLRRSWRLILVEDAVFAVVFVIFLLIRYGNGDLWHFYLGGERPMDFAYFNAILKTNYFPPYDPWFAGGQMNYYYFGFVLVSVPIKLLGIVPALAYNIVLPMLAALTAVGAFSVGFNLFKVANRKSANQQIGQSAIWVGVLAALFVVFIGNLGELHLIYTKLGEMGASQFRSTIPGLAGLVSAIRGLGLVLSGKPLVMNVEWWYWNASRIMTNGEINEFPFFTFLYSDLHAHMIAFPLTVLMVGIALGWTLRRQWRSVDALVSVGIGAIVVGVARANNTWDYPTYLALALIALFISGLHEASGLHALISGGMSLGLFGAAWVLGGINDIPTFLGLAASVFVAGQLLHQVMDGASEWRWIDLAVIGVMGLSILYFRPYIASYATAYSSVELWNGPRSPLQAYLLIHGIFLFPIFIYLLVQLRRMGWRWFAAALKVSDEWWVWALFTAVIATVAVVMLALIGYTVILIAAPLMALTLLILMQRHLDSARRFILLGVLMALALTFAVEVVVLKGDIGRMNTVFKFYLQVWIILAIAAAVMTGWVFERSRRWSGDWRESWTVALVALVASGLLYPILATHAKINDRFDRSLGPTFDAMKFMTVARANEQGQEYSFRDEYDALIWMQDNIQGTPVVAESAAAPEYRSLRNRVPMYTGLPAIIGYNYHQKQQRSILGGEVVDRRVADVNLLFTTIDANQAWSLIQKYGVGYVIVGYPERLYYPAQGIAKFDQMVSAGLLRVVYKNDHVTLYQVVK